LVEILFLGLEVKRLQFPAYVKVYVATVNIATELAPGRVKHGVEMGCSLRVYDGFKKLASA
jgi:hypothetical protein